MESTIEKYILKNQTINIRLTTNKNSKILNDIHFYYLTLENDDMLQKIILSDKYISVQFNFDLGSYKNINILPYTKQIEIYNYITSKDIIDILHKSVNLQKLIIRSCGIYENTVKNKLAEMKFLKSIEIIFTNDVNVEDIYKITQIKSLDTLHLFEYELNNYIDSGQIFQILCHIVNNLNKNIKIVLDWYAQGDKFRKAISLITYNFKINKFDYVFTYISQVFVKFDNLYDFNLCYL